MTSLNTLNAPKKDINQAILEAREQRYQRIQNHLDTAESVPVILKSITPGKHKQIPMSRIHVKLIHHLIMKVFKPLSASYEQSLDGDYYMYTYKTSPQKIKKRMVFIEKHHPLGRFIDIDVYTKTKAVSRTDLGLSPRKCILCDKPAHVCARSKNHSQKALLEHMHQKTKETVIKAIKKEALKALRRELYLHPKFGLVSRKSSGIHTMDYTHFLASIEALDPYFQQYLEVDIDQPESLKQLRSIGINAEKAMLEATGGHNTHKGIIFIFGLILPYYLKHILHQNSFTVMLEDIKKAAQQLTKHDFENLNNKTELSHGEKVYLTYGIKGIRGEVSEGFPSIMGWYKKYPYNDYQKLCAIMSRLDDTTIIKRKNLGTLKTIKQEMQALLEERTWIQNYYETLSEQYLKNNISPGGAADLLAVTFFFEATDYLFSN